MGSLFLLQLVLWLGFLVHRSPRFPGSVAGGILAVSGALLMVVPPILYSAAKRTEFFKRIITRRISLGTLLSWHVYTSVAGSILAVALGLGAIAYDEAGNVGVGRRRVGGRSGTRCRRVLPHPDGL